MGQAAPKDLADQIAQQSATQCQSWRCANALTMRRQTAGPKTSCSPTSKVTKPKSLSQIDSLDIYVYIYIHICTYMCLFMLHILLACLRKPISHNRLDVPSLPLALPFPFPCPSLAPSWETLIF